MDKSTCRAAGRAAAVAVAEVMEEADSRGTSSSSGHWAAAKEAEETAQGGKGANGSGTPGFEDGGSFENNNNQSLLSVR